MKLLVVDNGTRHLPSLLELLAEHDLQVVPWKVFSEQELGATEAVILSGGSSLSVIDHDREYHHELALIRASTLPIVGICLGYELIAHAYRSTLRRLERKEKGLVQLQVVHPHPIVEGISEGLVYEGHRWVVDRVEEPLIELASSKDGCEILIHGSKPIYGFQFHPEMLPETTAGAEIMRKCLQQIQTRQDR